jgi:hypothetical protein
MTKLYMVETLSQFRHRYVVEISDDATIDDATYYVLNNDNVEEMSQYHLGELDFSTREITKEEYLKLFNEDNYYLSEWSDEKKFTLINKYME